MPTKTGNLRVLAYPPSVDQVLRSTPGADAVRRFGHDATVKAIRLAISATRASALNEAQLRPNVEQIALAAAASLGRADSPRMARVFNLTGTVLHTNLGRALIAEAAIEAAIVAMRHASTVEYDIDTGQRGERDDPVRDLIHELTGAEDAVVVNNNAAAVLLTLNTLALGREAVVSRGELIEIGGAFRLPDIMARAGCRLVEVGTTNRTHLRDFEQALGADTGLVLKAHTSNFAIQGFTASVAPRDLAAAARARGVPFEHDLGSGALTDLSRFGLKPEPTVREALEEGADLVTFSGDKLLGGPQVGIIAGRGELVRRIAKNPMKRALRADKIRLAILEATLKLYRDPAKLPTTLPTMKFLARTRAEIAEVAERLGAAIAGVLGEEFKVTATECSSQIGSGAAPVDTLPSAGIAIEPVRHKGAGSQLMNLASGFRRLPIPVIGRINDDRLVLDLRCLDDEAAFVAQLGKLKLAPSRQDGDERAS